MTLSARVSASLLGGLVLSGVVVGCTTRTETYSISLKNGSTQRLMVGLAKDGPPFEDNWASPEEVATFDRRADERGWGVPVMPGKTAEVVDEKAKLEPQTTVYVRVYAETPSLAGILAVSRGSPNRLDIPLNPGMNVLVVTDPNGKLAYTRGVGQ
jgi:hypothetical protein